MINVRKLTEELSTREEDNLETLRVLVNQDSVLDSNTTRIGKVLQNLEDKNARKGSTNEKKNEPKKLEEVIKVESDEEEEKVEVKSSL